MDEAAKNALYATQNGYGYTVPNGHINNGGDCKYKHIDRGGETKTAVFLFWKLIEIFPGCSMNF